MTGPVIPQRINRIEDLAYNLWWSWHDDARSVFRILDYPLWRLSGHNPIKVLKNTSPDIFRAAIDNEVFLNLYDSVVTKLDENISGQYHLTSDLIPLKERMVAYFSMEYAIHTSLPIYAGGLGILAGDICKEMSDMGMSAVAVGFMYPQGYFHQHIGADGWQQEIYNCLNFDEAPITQVRSSEGKRALTYVKLGEINLAIGAWLVRVGRTNIYLLDTDLEENPETHRGLVSRLYVADPETRLQQELILGIGGVRILRTLGINPSIWHGNEGHTAFLAVERLREEIRKGIGLEDAARKVQSSTVFTTHTPVKAGHDIFPKSLIEKYFGEYCRSAGITLDTILSLGNHDSAESFNMTALALRMADKRSAVSKLHGEVTRKMWHGLWPELKEDQVPISHVTNGIHVPSWIAPTMSKLFSEYLGENWLDQHDSPEIWDRVLEIPNEQLWSAHFQLKRKLGTTIRDRMRHRWLEDKLSNQQLIALGALFDPEALTIGFIRRFAEYKRPTLLFKDIERITRLVTNDLYPVHIIFCGKSHPADLQSKKILQQVYYFAADPALQGRIIFVEDYDMDIARYLVQGVDVWLNSPRRTMEASGTSGMKAVLNGALHLSVRDGWWYEAFNGNNGWAIGSELPAASPEEEDYMDAESIYDLLEKEIVPLYYTRDRKGVPHGWVRLMKESIRSLVPRFSARRMLKQYISEMYLPLLDSMDES